MGRISIRLWGAAGGANSPAFYPKRNNGTWHSRYPNLLTE